MYHNLNQRINNIAHYNAVNAARECFCCTAEAEQLIYSGSYPFSLGSGSVSMTPFGIPIYFKHKILGVALSSASTDMIPEVEFFIEHLAKGSNVPTIVSRFILDSEKFVNLKIDSAVFPAGQICFRVGSTSELSDDFAKYRIAVYVQAEESL